jgi:hypothetical protein
MGDNAGPDAAVWPTVRPVTGILIAAFVVCLVIAVAQRIALFVDGSNEFLAALQGPDWWLHSRFLSRFLSRLPVHIGISWGVTDLDTLLVLFGVGMFGHFALMLGVCTLAARDRSEYVLFPLASFFLVSANLSFYPFNGSHLLVSVFWSLLFVVTMPRMWSGTWAVTGILLAVIALACYESMLILGVVLAAAAFWRARRVERRWLRAGALTIGVLNLAGVGIAAASIMDQGSDRYSGGLWSLPYSGTLHGPAVLSLAAFGLILCARRTGPRAWRAAAVILVAACTLWVATGIRWPEYTVNMFVQHKVRFMNLTFIGLLAGLFFVTLRWGGTWAAATWLRAGRVLAVTALMQTSWLVLTANDWAHYLRLVEQESNARSGIIPFDETVLAKELVDDRPVRVLTGGWSTPLLSLLSARNGEVRGLIGNPPWWNGWVALDLGNPERVFFLERFGFRFDHYLEAINGK